MKTATKPEYDFQETNDPLEVQKLFSKRAGEIDKEIQALKTGPTRYSGPNNEKVSALEDEFKARQSAYDLHMEKIKTAWLEGGYGDYASEIGKQESSLDGQILELLQKVKTLADERAQIAAREAAARKFYGRLLVSVNQDAQGRFYLGVDTFVLGRKIHLAPDGGQGTSDDVLNVYLAKFREK